MTQEVQILIPIILIITIIILILIFRKKIFIFFVKLIHLFKDIFRGIKNGIIGNKDVIIFLKNHPNIHKFLKQRFDKNNIYGYKLTKIILFFVFASFLFTKVIQNYVAQKILIQSDIRISNLIFYFRDIDVFNFFTLITNFGNPIIITIFTTLFIIYSFLLKKKKYIIPMLSSIFFATFSNIIIKNIFERPRPDVSFYIEHGFSFPSGYSTIAVAFYGFISYFLIRNIKNRKKKFAIIFFSTTLIFIIGFSRIYLGSNYLSDVIGGFLLGAMCLSLSVFISEILINKKEDHHLSFNKEIKRITYAIFFIALTFLISFTIFHKQNINVIQNNTNQIKIESLDNISNEFDKNSLTKYSEMLSGKSQQPMSFIIVAKNDEEILNFFEKAGWSQARYPDLKSLAKVAKSAILNKEDETAPMTPSFWNAQIHNFGFQKSTSEKTARKRHHARFWKTNMITNDGKIVYIGTASFDIGIKWGITHTIDPDIDTEREFLFNDLNKTGLIKDYKKEKFVKPVLGKNFAGDFFFTNGEAYIIEI